MDFVHNKLSIDFVLEYTGPTTLVALGCGSLLSSQHKRFN